MQQSRRQQMLQKKTLTAQFSDVVTLKFTVSSPVRWMRFTGIFTSLALGSSSLLRSALLKYTCSPSIVAPMYSNSSVHEPSTGASAERGASWNV